MMKMWFEIYKNWVEKTSWKTFFKFYFLLALYALFRCGIEANGSNFCILLVPFYPMLFMNIALTLLPGYYETTFPETIWGTWIVSWIPVAIVALIINYHRFLSPQNPLYYFARKTSYYTKHGVFLYFIIIILGSLLKVTLGYSCSLCVQM